MKAAAIQNHINRTYRESGTYQWARETLINAVEGNATGIEYVSEWQAVESFGHYRRTNADNGCGMTGGELVDQRQPFLTDGGNFLSPVITLSLGGLLAEEAVIAHRLAGKHGRRRAAA